ncbi:hypothetical protein COCON_G00113700 [Conger conger]|uniref:Uncharacterized protein n=1 Tax=Conger conger TaxID=82655 RepID=A0A9Q1HW92_CONCO|nr:hypothetical protein COCON_G00113700 [Conger conger]
MPDQKLRKIASHSSSPWSYTARCDKGSACVRRGWRSVPITSSVPVLYWRGGAAQQPCWQPGLFNITTGCTCVNRTAL